MLLQQQAALRLRAVVDGKSVKNNSNSRERIMKVPLINFMNFSQNFQIPRTRKMNMGILKSIFDQNKYDIQILQ